VGTGLANLPYLKNHAKSVYCSGAGVSLTYEQAFAAVDGLAEELGAGIKGKIVGIYLSNSAAFLIAYQAVLRAGGRPALLNVGLPKASIEKMLDDMDMALIFASEEVTGVPTYVFSDAQLASTLETLSPVEVTPSGATANGAGPRTTMKHGCLLRPLAMSMAISWGSPIQFYGARKWSCLKSSSPISWSTLWSARGLLGLWLPRDLKPLIFRICASARAVVRHAPFPVATHEKWEKATGLKIYEGLGMTEIAPLAVNTAEHGTN